VVFHNVAQVPLARDAAQFQSVNVTGTAVLLEAALASRVHKVVYTSSSAVFGVPSENPVTVHTPPRPMEAYGWAKYEGELLCRAAASRGLDVSIVRPRTILGHGRLGIFAILFDWIADGAGVPVLGSGHNRYQFVHANDLAAACLLAAERPGPGTYNIGSEDVQTMRETLEHLCAFAGTGATVRSVPAAPASAAMAALSRTGLAPFGPYHWMMYGKEMWFDLSAAHDELGWRGVHDTDSMFRESYDWYLAHRDSPTSADASHHRSPARQGALRALKLLIR
jgi:nucleoside-diphosphate-sugar epimerase